MKIKIEVKDKDLNVLDINEYEFGEFCDLLSRKVISVLYLVEDYLNDNNSVDFKDIRKNILDVAGEIQRLPISIQFKSEV